MRGRAYDAGFNPSEPRDYHGRWSQTGGVKHLETNFAPPSDAIDKLASYTSFLPLNDYPEEEYRVLRKQMHAWDKKSVDPRNAVAAEGIVQAFDKLAENDAFNMGSLKHTMKFTFCAWEPPSASMMTMHSPSGFGAWLVNTEGYFVVDTIKAGQGSNYACEFIRNKLKSTRMSDDDILRDYYKICMWHEFAHHVDNETGGGAHNALVHIVSGITGSSPFIMEEGKGFFDWVGKNISPYATSMPEELFAETFSKWMTAPQDLPLEVREFFNHNFTSVHKKATLDEEKQIQIHVYPDPKIEDKNGNITIDKAKWEKALQAPTKDANRPRGAGLALLDPNGYMLFVKRNEHGDHGGKWAFPGGKVESHETPEKAAERETIEEIGYVSNGEYPVSFTTHDPVRFETFIKPVEGQFEPSWLMEHSAYTWRRPSNPPEPLHPGVRNFLYKLNGYVAAYDAGFDPNELRVPKGSQGGGQWTKGGAVGPKHYELNTEVLKVGGDDWNKQTALRLEHDYAAIKEHLDELAHSCVHGEAEIGETEEEEEDAPIIPEEWDMLTTDQQEEAEKEWKSHSHEDFYNSEYDNWYSENAPGEAKHKVAEDFMDDSERDWAKEALEKLHDQEDYLRFPFTDEQILDAIVIEDSSKYEEWNNVEFSFDESKLDSYHKPDPDILPGMESHIMSGSEMLNEDMRSNIIKYLEDGFEVEWDRVRDHLEAPDYLEDNISEFQDEMWNDKSDDEKFSIAKEYLDSEIFEPEEGEKPAPQELDKFPDQIEPLDDPDTKEQTYKRTQLLARLLFQKRAAEILKERNLNMTPQEVASLDSTLWSGWKSSSQSLEGKAIQVATAEELGARLRKPEWKKDVDLHYTKEDFDNIKALIRAKWETTQYLLDKSGNQKLKLFRGINLRDQLADPKKWFIQKGYITSQTGMWHVIKSGDESLTEKYPTEFQANAALASHIREEEEAINDPKSGSYQKKIDDYIALPNVHIARNGAASTSLSRSVANDWASSDGRVVLRTIVPRTSVISIPAYGINVHSEREVVIAGAAWEGWDAWKETAPTFESVPLQAAS